MRARSGSIAARPAASSWSCRAARQAEGQNPEQKKIASLTPRERQIVAEIGSDASAGSRAIAERLHISEHTLRNHIASIYEKLQVSSRLELFAYAAKHNITPA